MGEMTDKERAENVAFVLDGQVRPMVLTIVQMLCQSVRAAENEACARIAEELELDTDSVDSASHYCFKIAAAIRDRLTKD